MNTRDAHTGYARNTRTVTESSGSKLALTPTCEQSWNEVPLRHTLLPFSLCLCPSFFLRTLRMANTAVQAQVRDLPPELCGNAVAEQLYADLRAGAYAPIAAHLRRLSDLADWDAKDFYVDTLVAAVRHFRPLWIVAWQRAAPTEGDAWLVGGAHAVVWAWYARGNGQANSVSGDAFDVFDRRLEIAEEQLSKATAISPRDPTAWTWLLTSGRGLGVAPEVELERFRAAVAEAPEHESAHHQYLQYLCAKWHGSDEAMFGFARAVTATALDGSGVHDVIVQAHVEHHLQLDDRLERANYFALPAVRNEILAAAHKCVLSPVYHESRSTPKHRNLFAFAFFSMGERELARVQFDLFGESITSGPWNYYGRPVQQVAMARRSLGMPELEATADIPNAVDEDNNDDNIDDDDDGIGCSCSAM